MEPDEREARRNTEGRARLIEHIAAGHTQTELAKQVGIAQSAVNAWLSGNNRPEPEFREVLRVVLGIDPLLWLTKHEREIIERAQLARAEREAAA